MCRTHGFVELLASHAILRASRIALEAEAKDIGGLSVELPRTLSAAMHRVEAMAESASDWSWHERARAVQVGLR